MWQNNMFTIFIVSSLEPVLSPDPIYQYLGCFNEYAAGGRYTMPKLSERITHYDECIKECRAAGKVYVGISWTDACYCDDINSKYNEFGKRDDSHCNYECYDGKRRCGGKGDDLGYPIISVFRVCFNHKFGAGCKEDCHCGKEQNSECNPINGECRGGDQTCELGWHFWPECQIECHCLAGVPCDENGKCSNSRGEKCALGYYGFPECATSCSTGWFGDGCKKFCSHCKDHACEPVNGTCDSCAPGFIGDTCQEYCHHGSYGPNCNGTCSSNCADNDPCSMEDGSCPDGCKKGYEGARCDKESNATKLSALGAVKSYVIAALLILFAW